LKKQKNAKQRTSWLTKSSATNGGNPESGVCATAEDGECERKSASYGELEDTLPERSDGNSGEIVNRTDDIKPEDSASYNELTIVNFSDPYLWPELLDRLKCHLSQHGPV
jgi:hypothetical protein